MRSKSVLKLVLLISLTACSYSKGKNRFLASVETKTDTLVDVVTEPSPTPTPTPNPIIPKVAFDSNWDQTTSTDYTYSNSIEFTGGVCTLSLSDQIDNDSDASKGFGGGQSVGIASYGSLTGVPAESGLKLGSSGSCDGTAAYCASILDATWTPGYSSIVSYWKLDNSWNDSIGSSNFTAVGAPTFDSTTHLGGTHAATFNGTTQYATVSDTANFQFGSGDFTISYWYYPRENCSAWDNNWGLNQWTTGISSGSNSWIIGNCDTSTNQFSAMIESGTTVYWTGATTPWTINNWYHLVFTRIGTTASFYINGVASGSVAVGTASVNSLGLPLRIANSVSDTLYTNGTYDEIAIWKGRGLSTAEVKAIYNAQVGGVTASRGGFFTSRVIDAWESNYSWTSLAWKATLPFLKMLPDYSGSIQNETASTYPALASDTLMTGIVGLWHLTESSATVGATNDLADTSGSGNFGEATGGVTFGSAGPLTKALTFDGTSGYAAISSTPGSALDTATAGDFTMAAWVKVISLPATDCGTATATCSGAIIHRSGGPFVGPRITHGGNICATLSNSADVTYAICSGTPISIGVWSHLVFTVNATSKTLRLYVDGIEVSGGPVNYLGTLKVRTGQAYYLGVGDPFYADYIFRLNGSIAEAAVWSRELSATEAKQLYQRGASKIKFQVKSCASSDCSDTTTWMGPDGTASTYFSELYNMSTQAASPSGTVKNSSPSMTLQNYTSPVGTNRYFQYRTVFESSSTTAALLPELMTVTAGTDHYDSSVPTVTSKSGIDFDSLATYTETLGSDGCTGGVLYNLGTGASATSAKWYWWNGSTWAEVTSSGITQASSAATVNTHAAAFSTLVGPGKVYFKAFLQSDGLTACEIDQLSVSGKK